MKKIEVSKATLWVVREHNTRVNKRQAMYHRDKIPNLSHEVTLTFL